MTWIKLDDKAPRHPKIGGLSDRAFRWWVSGLCYASEFLTDGALPFLFTRDVPQKTINELCAAGLWTLGEKGYHIHNYVEHQSVKADVQRERERSRERQAKWKAQRKSNAVTDASVTPPGNGGVTEPENREQIQRTDTEKTPSVSVGRPRHTPLIVSPIAFDKAHGQHVSGFCAFVCLPQTLWDGWVNRVMSSGLSLEAATSQVRVFADGVVARWKASGAVPGGSDFDFWRAEWSQAHPAPSSRPAAAQRSSTAAFRASLVAKEQA